MTALDRLLADVATAAAAPLPGREALVAAAIAPYLADPDLLADRACPGDPARYTRHLLHNDSKGYAVVAIVWSPGQMSPVHGHRTWCALGVQRGLLTETFFRAEGDVALPTTCLARRAGDTSHAPADRLAIHRLANLGTQEAVSLHVYGVAFDRFGDGVNHIWAG
ncbi:MAG: cysteine dioxygenase family protein [Rhodospirillales bacterium]|nr:cysteine dioxygenase family protein [Rhodospirillales bacterium]